MIFFEKALHKAAFKNKLQVQQINFHGLEKIPTYIIIKKFFIEMDLT